jgi:hypothetical protein
MVLSNCGIDAVSLHPTYRKPFDSMFQRIKQKDGAPGETRTPDPLVRSQMLYPTELRAHRTNDNAIKHLQPFPKLVEFRFSVRSVQLRRFSTQLKPFRPEVRNPSQPFLPLLCGTPRHAVKVQGTKKRRRTIRERREIVEETPLPGASVSRVARRHDINANQVFYWSQQEEHPPRSTDDSRGLCQASERVD